MTDLQTRFKTLDTISTPDLWDSIEERAVAMKSARRSNPWVLVAVILLLVLVIGGAVLVGSGIVKLPAVVDTSASPSASAQQSSASSTPGAPVPASWMATGSMLGSRQMHTATRLPDGTVLVAGGVTGIANQELSSAELYDPGTGTWTATGSMVEARYLHTATLLATGKVLVVGGANTTASAELYDPSTRTWTATGNMMEARSDFSATLLASGKVLVAGGHITVGGGEVQVSRSAELYDPETGNWSGAGEMVTPRTSHTATLLPDGTVLLAGSADFGQVALLPSAELYDPVSGAWTATGNMVEVRFGHSATLLDDGTVFVAGGASATSGHVTGSAELYDPALASWTATTSMPEANFLPAVGGPATLLSNGRVLFPGGIVSSNGDSFVRSSWLFDPDTASWTETVGMPAARTGTTATLLLDGGVLTAGGLSDPATVSASAELYDPGSGS
jgi:galactose oxidase-like protein